MTDTGSFREYRKFVVILIVMALLSPVGLYFPQIMKAGSAWGEWGIDEIREMVGYEPQGMKKTAEVWKAPMPDYAIPGQENAPLSRLSLFYILSGFIGILVCGGGTWLLGRWLAGKKK
jgi:cobalt/nickel transport protein